MPLNSAISDINLFLRLLFLQFQTTKQYSIRCLSQTSAKSRSVTLDFSDMKTSLRARTIGLPLTSSLLLEYSSEYLNEYSSTR